MVIGDKVRMLHSHGEGVITKVGDETAMVMLSQGIEIPVPKKHLVVVATRLEAVQVEKAGTSGKPVQDVRSPAMLFLSEGLYLAGIPRSASMLDFFLVNPSDYHLSIVVYKLARPSHQFLGHFLVQGKSTVSIPGPFSKNESNHLLGLAFQFLKFHHGQGNQVPAGEFRLAFSQTPWEKTRQRIPLLEQEGYLIQLDSSPGLADPEKLKESLLSPKLADPVRGKKAPENSVLEVDLHIEKLVREFSAMTAAEILDHQLRHFEKSFDRAIALGLKKMIVIHGVGNGVLRMEVHRRLSSSQDIRHFRDARKERFGYGATEIEF